MKKSYGIYFIILSEICVNNKKVFSHELTLYDKKELMEHINRGCSKKDKGDQGFRGHPKCNFCNIRFYDNDGLFEHCRDKHEKCFICNKLENRCDVYYEDYNKLVTKILIL